MTIMNPALTALTEFPCLRSTIDRMRTAVARAGCLAGLSTQGLAFRDPISTPGISRVIDVVHA